MPTFSPTIALLAISIFACLTRTLRSGKPGGALLGFASGFPKRAPKDVG
jgi:hypothetical protein